MPKKLSGFTLVELMAVVVILGILVAMAVPGWVKSVEEAKNQEAIAGLKLIRTAQRMYYIEYERYYPPASGTVNDIATLNSDLEVELESQHWLYATTSNNGAAGTATFTATATRVDGHGKDRQISIDNTGALNCTGQYCPQL